MCVGVCVCVCVYVCVHAHVCAQLRLTLCDLRDYNLPGSSVHGIFQARLLEWVAISFSRGSPDLGTELVSLVSPALAGRFFATGKPIVICTKYYLGSSLEMFT